MGIGVSIAMGIITVPGMEEWQEHVEFGPA